MTICTTLSSSQLAYVPFLLQSLAQTPNPLCRQISSSSHWGDIIAFSSLSPFQALVSALTLSAPHQTLNHLKAVQRYHPISLAAAAATFSAWQSPARWPTALSHSYHPNSLPTLQRVHYSRICFQDSPPSSCHSPASKNSIQTQESRGPVISSCLIPEWSASSPLRARYLHAQH